MATPDPTPKEPRGHEHDSRPGPRQIQVRRRLLILGTEEADQTLRERARERRDGQSRGMPRHVRLAHVREDGDHLAAGREAVQLLPGVREPQERLRDDHDRGAGLVQPLVDRRQEALTRRPIAPRRRRRPRTARCADHRLDEERRREEPTLFDVLTLAEERGIVLATGGLKVEPNHTLDDCPPQDVLVVPGVGRPSRAVPRLTAPPDRRSGPGGRGDRLGQHRRHAPVRGRDRRRPPRRDAPEVAGVDAGVVPKRRRGGRPARLGGRGQDHLGGDIRRDRPDDARGRLSPRRGGGAGYVRNMEYRYSDDNARRFKTSLEELATGGAGGDGPPGLVGRRARAETPVDDRR